MNHVTPIMTFGWKSDVVDNGILISDKKILFVANRFLVIHNEVDLTEEIETLNKDGFATALTVSEDKHIAAVAMNIPGHMAEIGLYSIPFGKKTTLSAEVVENEVNKLNY
jgi:hypothetical protein